MRPKKLDNITGTSAPFLSLLLSSAALLPTIVHAVQPSAPAATAAPLRNLTWGQLNVLHSTDTHGWHAGHLSEAAYSGDWGDYISFASRMRSIADSKGVDLLLVDTGDRIEGNGLYDASSPKGKYTLDIVPHQDIDLICSGNHELYKNTSSWNEVTKTIPSFKGNYLASNLDIWNNDTQKYEALAPRYKTFTTPNQKIRVLAFGFLYNFQGNSNNTRVQKVEDTVKENWFQDALRDTDIDLVIVIGHVAIRSDEYQTIFQAIRTVKWDTPIQFFGGHTHIRDFVRFDKQSTALESGRYMETIGWLSIDGLNIKKSSNSVDAAASSLTFNRRYIDNNLFSYQHHTGLNESTFETEKGRSVSQMIADARRELKLDHTFGCVPKTLWTSRVAADNESSIYRWLAEDVFTSLGEQENKTERSRPKLIITNTGAIRFDLYKGPYTVDSQFLVSPFTSGFGIVRDVKYSAAQRVLEVLNKESHLFAAPEMLAYIQNPSRFAASATHAKEMHGERVAEDELMAGMPGQQLQQPLHASSKDSDGEKHALSQGYVTTDDDGSEGDDTLHAQIPYVKTPAAIQARLNFPSTNSSSSSFSALAKEKLPKTVDIAYNAFIQSRVLSVLQFLGENVTEADTDLYLGGKTMTAVISDWVQKHWPCKTDE